MPPQPFGTFLGWADLLRRAALLVVGVALFRLRFPPRALRGLQLGPAQGTGGFGRGSKFRFGGNGNPVAKIADVIEPLADPEGHGGDGVLRNVDRESRFLSQELIQSTEQRSASGEDDASIDQIGRQLGWRTLQR